MTSGVEAGTLFDPTTLTYVEVAVPVPLRRVFTYALPPTLTDVPVGSRVAVPFGSRKLPGIVLGVRAEPPPGVDKVRPIAGLLEREALFPDELLRFLREAAEYYLHPIGEVLRAAAPALPADALRSLRKGGFLDAGERLPGRSVGRRRVRLVRKIDVQVDRGRLGDKQRAVLELLDREPEVTVARVRELTSAAGATLRALEARGLLSFEEREEASDPFFEGVVERDEPPELHPRQREAVDAIVAALRDGTGETFLLHGVTGSGKTEVYLHAIAEARSRGKGALLLVPEIALTPQLVARFRARFGEAISVLHSGLGERERDDAWRRLRRGELGIAIGARSALFAPVLDLGIVVVDEEHDPSFKQEEGFRYHARDMALLRAHRAGAVCVLGSATPAVETYHRAKQRKIRLLELPDRATRQRLPSVEVVDLARHRSGPSGEPLISAPLHRALETCLGEGGQAILFLNRRGFAPSVFCAGCGHVLECPACSVALTEHRRIGLLRCHYCDFARPCGDRCIECGSREIERIGMGTERLETTLSEVFAPARVERLDRDTANASRMETLLDRFRRREIDVLVGTQMVTKGHDLPGVTLVGVILADQSLVFPDFRASERTFQLLAQVAGRAGRGERAGRVVFQTYQPNHSSIRRAAAHDYTGFFADEIAARREVGYSPFARLVAVRVDAGGENEARSAAETLATLARGDDLVRRGVVDVLGPAPAPIARIRARFRFRLLLRSSNRAALRRLAHRLVGRIDEGLGPARASVDVDPVSML